MMILVSLWNVSLLLFMSFLCLRLFLITWQANNRFLCHGAQHSSQNTPKHTQEPPPPDLQQQEFHKHEDLGCPVLTVRFVLEYVKKLHRKCDIFSLGTI